MKFSYCPVCGTKLVKRLMDDEGVAPYCDTCRRPRFDLFKVAVIGLVENECGEAALIRQRSFSSSYESLVSGFVSEGERAEDALVREIAEELGIGVEGLRFEGTHWFEAKEILMMGFFARARKQPFRLTQEVDGARWVPLRQAVHLVHPRPALSRTLIEMRLAECGETAPDNLVYQAGRRVFAGPMHGNRTRLQPMAAPLAS